ncbi:hypothetical protein LTR66_017293, partial [Elasticomyces elasticus]
MVDVQQTGDYPIVLGNSLKDNVSPSSNLFSFRHNYTPEDGFRDTTATLKGSISNYDLRYRTQDSNYDYSGWQTEHDRPQLALFYDKQKSVFVLEQLAASFDLNLGSASDLSTSEIKSKQQISRPKHTDANGVNHDHDTVNEDSDRESEADEYNPFDYRHFLSEAREAAEHASTRGNGHLTPLPGSGTPLSGMNSPLPSAKLLSSPHLGASARIVSGDETPRPIKKRRMAANTARKAPVSAASTARPRASSGAAKHKQLSAEQVLNSDSSDDETHETTKPTSKHSRTTSKVSNLSQTSITITHPPEDLTSSSPRDADLEDNSDADDGGLEIVEDNSSRKPTKERANINLNAFRNSNTNTPLARPAKPAAPTRKQSEHDQEINSLLLADEDDDDDEDHNNDVESIDLNTSSSPPTPAPQRSSAAQRPTSTNSTVKKVSSTKERDATRPPASRARRQSTIESTSRSHQRRKSSPET